MKRTLPFAAVLLVAMLYGAPRALAQDGSIEFLARATPSGGLEEPVRGFPFYLLTKSFDDITKETDAAIPKPDMDAFIDKLDVSKELKAWMKKNQWVTLTGEDFIHKVHPADVMEVPEFYEAYLGRNSGDQSSDFPKAKFKASEKAKDPAKYERLEAEYKEAVRRYVEQNPESIDGMDLDLAPKDPSPKWNDLAAKRAPEIHRRALLAAQSKYLVARTETNLQGEGFFHGIPAGTYWLSTLDVSADVGDARLRWDLPITVGPGAAAYVALSNANAVQPPSTSP